MKTRNDYMNGNTTHAEYYSQFVDFGTVRLVAGRIGLTRIQHSKDKHLNDIPLKIWDSIGRQIDQRMIPIFKAAGDFTTLAGLVCITKQAAREAAKFNDLGCNRALMLTGYCNGDKHPKATNPSDKNECAKLWERDAKELGEKMTTIAKGWGFDHLDFGVGMYPTLQRSTSDTSETEHFPYTDNNGN